MTEQRRKRGDRLANACPWEGYYGYSQRNLRVLTRLTAVRARPNRQHVMSAEAPVIETRELSKVYPGRPPKTALDRLTLSVNRGEVFGYLGPNGAGKTTTIKLLLDLIRPTSGSVSLFGLDANRDSVAIRRRVGFLPGELNLWDNQTSLEVIRYFGRVRGSLDMSYVKTLAERLDFDLTRKIRTYSTGNKRKLGLILAFMN